MPKIGQIDTAIERSTRTGRDELECSKQCLDKSKRASLTRELAGYSKSASRRSLLGERITHMYFDADVGLMEGHSFALPCSIVAYAYTLLVYDSDSYS